MRLAGPWDVRRVQLHLEGDRRPRAVSEIQALLELFGAAAEAMPLRRQIDEALSAPELARLFVGDGQWRVDAIPGLLRRVCHVLGPQAAWEGGAGRRGGGRRRRGGHEEEDDEEQAEEEERRRGERGWTE